MAKPFNPFNPAPSDKREVREGLVSVCVGFGRVQFVTPLEAAELLNQMEREEREC